MCRPRGGTLARRQSSLETRCPTADASPSSSRRSSRCSRPCWWAGAWLAAQAPDPLTLTITASRAECTAGTLNPVTWTITGGTPPYTLTVDGESADADADQRQRHLREPARGREPRHRATITATVTDATGAPATASAAYTIVPPLPAPDDGLDLAQCRHTPMR